MSDLDDRIRRALRDQIQPLAVDGILERLLRRKRRRDLARKSGVALLSLSIAGAGVIGIARVRGPFLGSGGRPTGVIVLAKTLRACPGFPEIGGPHSDVFAVAPDGGTEWNLSEGLTFGDRERTETTPRFSPDGTRYVWRERTRSASFLTDLRTGKTTRISGYQLNDMSWSPDGRSIAYSTWDPERNPQQMMAPTSIFVLDVETLEATRLTTGPGNTSDAQPIWSPDGEAIAFLRARVPVGVFNPTEGTVDVASDRPRQELWFMDADGSDQRRVAVQPDDAEFTVIRGDWSPDGLRFVAEVAVASGDHELYVVNIDGRTGYKLTDGVGYDTSPSWSPDGQWIAFHTERYGSGVGHSEIAMVRADGSDVTRLTNDCWDDFDPQWVGGSSLIESFPPWSPSNPASTP